MSFLPFPTLSPFQLDLNGSSLFLQISLKESDTFQSNICIQEPVEVLYGPFQDTKVELEQGDEKYVSEEVMRHLGIQEVLEDSHNIQIQESVPQHPFEVSTEVSTGVRMPTPETNTVSAVLEATEELKCLVCTKSYFERHNSIFYIPQHTQEANCSGDLSVVSFSLGKVQSSIMKSDFL